MSQLNFSKSEMVSQSIAAISSVINGKHADESAKHILFKSVSQDKIELYATDKEIQVSIGFKPDVMLGTINHAVNAARLRGIMGSIQNGAALSMSLEQKVKLASEGMEISLPIFKGDFPVMPDFQPDSIITLEAKPIYEALSKVFPYISNGKGDKTLGGVYWHIGNSQALMNAAPDGTALASTMWAINTQANEQIVLPLKVAKLIKDSLKDLTCFVHVKTNGDYVRFEVGNLAIQFARQEALFPVAHYMGLCTVVVDNVKSPKKFKTEFAVKCADLAKSLRVAAQFGESVDVALNNSKLNFSLNNEAVGGFKSSITVNSTVDLTMKLSPIALMSACSHLGAEVVTLSLDGQTQGFAAKVSIPGAAIWLTAMN